MIRSSILIVTILATSGFSARVANLTVENGGPNGLWRLADDCPRFEHAIGFSMKVEPSRGPIEDDTSVNAICLACVRDSNTSDITTICSGEGHLGVDAGYFPCPVLNGVQTYLVSFSLEVDEEDGDTDETGVNNIKFACQPRESDEYSFEVEGFGVDFHNSVYGNWSDPCPPRSAICGIQTRIQGSQGILDDTTLNDVKFECCDWVFGDEDY